MPLVRRRRSWRPISARSGSDWRATVGRSALIVSASSVSSSPSAGRADQAHEHLLELAMAVHRLDAVAGCDQLRHDRRRGRSPVTRSSLPSQARLADPEPAASGQRRPTSATSASPIMVTVSLAVRSSTAPVRTTLPWSITTTWLQVCSTSASR